MPTTPTYALRYPAATDPADVPTDMSKLALDVEGALGAPLRSYGTTLPASPVNGQEAILVDSITNPSYQWRFRYNAGSTSAYKWEFIGGAPLLVEVLTQENSATVGADYNLTTLGPQWTIVRSGDYEITFGAQCLSSVATTCYIRGNTNGDAGSLGTVASATNVASSWSTLTRTKLLLALVAANILRMRYYHDAGTATWKERWIAVTPIRVS